MSTPLKAASFLKQAKHLSPVSRNSLFPSCLPSVTKSSPCRNEHTPRKLPFTNSSLLLPGDQSPSRLLVSPESKLKQKIGGDSNSNICTVLLNTPKKQDLLKYGVLNNKSFNILGKGSFGTVVKCIYKGKTVAIKVEKNLHRFSFPEMNGLNLNHENIVKTFDIIISDAENFALIVMEYCPESMNLQNILDDDQNTCLTRDKIKYYSKCITKGLVYLHERDIVHLDIKPRNILVCDGVCKICDFGNSVRLSQLHAEFNYQGTIAYTDPEILMGKKATKKSDVYSLGILFWQIKYRRTPYRDLDSNDLIIYKVVKYNLRPDSVYNSEEDTFSSIYSVCWSPNPQLRPEAKYILQMLEEM